MHNQYTTHSLRDIKQEYRDQHAPAIGPVLVEADEGSLVLQMIGIFRHMQPDKLAIQGSQTRLSYEQLWQEVAVYCQVLLQRRPGAIGIAMDNQPAWAVVDIASMHVHTVDQLVAVPLPLFFSPQQLAHAVMDAGVQAIVCDQPERMLAMLASQGISALVHSTQEVAGQQLTLLDISLPSKRLPRGTAKVTYTSGTTGNPKGVCLSNVSMELVAISLHAASEASGRDRHLSVLPLSTLLENIAGLYLPLISGATAILTGAAEVGLSGSSGLDTAVLYRALTNQQATTTVFTPELLQAFLMLLEAGHSKPPSLRFIAVGGASVSPQLLDRAAALELPVYEGYGLSECASVVALNTRQHQFAGSVGKPLPHVQVKIAADGEILVQGHHFLGYAGQDELPAQAMCATGDIGYLDVDGYLYITGRKKSMFITSFGRNVSPEWIERELSLSAHMMQAAMFGEAKPWNVAVIVARPQSSQAQVQASIDALNATLPDYARVARWIAADAPFTPANQQRTANGRLHRDAIWRHYAARIEALYQETPHAIL